MLSSGRTNWCWRPVTCETQALRERALDALVADARSLRPVPDLKTQMLHDMKGAFMVRHGHPLAGRRDGLLFDDLLAYPIASTPLRELMAQLLLDPSGQG